MINNLDLLVCTDFFCIGSFFCFPSRFFSFPITPLLFLSVSDVRSLSNIYSLHLRGCICQSQGLPQWVSMDLFPLSFPAFPLLSFSCSLCHFTSFPLSFSVLAHSLTFHNLCILSLLPFIPMLSCLPSLSCSLPRSLSQMFYLFDWALQKESSLFAARGSGMRDYGKHLRAYFCCLFKRQPSLR